MSSQSHPLSDKECLKIATVRSGDTRVMLYPHLAECETLDDVFGRGGGEKAIILYVNSADDTTVSGHWVGLARDLSNAPNEIRYIDPYGKPPDEMLKDYPRSWRSQSGQNEPFLTRLLKDWCEEDTSHRRVVFNDAGLQKSSKSINTCGRWAAFRLRHHTVSEEDFENTMKAAARARNVSPDELITEITNGLL